MLFPTVIFALFFAVVFALHWSLPERSWARKAVLLGGSLFFYGWWSWKFALMLLASAVLNHVCAVWMERTAGEAARKRILGWTVGGNLAVLGVFKYTGFLFTQCFWPLAVPICRACGAVEWLLELQENVFPFIERIVLPVGISFYTFQALSYVVDVYRRECRPAGSALDFANYLAFFPQLVAGPIVRASVLLPQMERLPERGMALDTGRAMTLILTGLFKKTVIANWIAGHLADPLFQSPEAYGWLDALLGTYGYALQIYCDFSAYSDIATGCALLLGFHFPDNFHAPYFSQSLQEFWRRWHISLSSWLRDYLYIPLGGSRAGKLKTYRNLALTMLLGGLWHGANWTFVFWGAFHGAGLAVERALGVKDWKVGAWVRGLVTFHLVCFAWIFFRSQTFGDAWAVLKAFTRGGAPELASWTGAVVLCAGFLLQFLDGDRPRKIWDFFNRLPAVAQALTAALLLTAILGLGPSGVAPFIYFQF